MTERTESPSAEVRIRVLKRDRFQCTYCGSPGTDAELEIDHIIAVAKGGSNHMSNLTTACRMCNQKKGAGHAPPRRKAEKPRDGLIGMFLHTFKDGQIEFQGCIIAIDGDMVLVQCFEWFWGQSSNVEAIPRSDIYSPRCRLYANFEQMNRAYENRYGRQRDLN